MRRSGRTGARERSPAGVALLVLVLSAPALAIAAVTVFAVLAEQQRHTFESRARAETSSVLAVLPGDVSGPAAEKVGQALRRPRQLEVVLVDARGAVTRSSPIVGLGDVPREVRDAGAVMTHRRTSVADVPFLVAGGATGSGSDVYLFFSERPLERDQDRLALVVTGTASAVLFVAVAGGWARTYRRVRHLAARRAREQAFTAHLAHELRTPVGALVTASSLVDESILRSSPDVLREPVELMRTQVHRLRGIVEDLLELSRLETGQVQLRLETVDLAQVAEETIRSCGWSDVAVEATGPQCARADRQSVVRLLLNLVGNARRHANGEVRVAVRGDEREVLLEVSDDGPGMDRDLVEVLTDPDRPGADRRSTSGRRGLGLLIVRAHAALLGAAVEVETGRGTGTAILLRLPRSEPDGTAGGRGDSVVLREA